MKQSITFIFLLAILLLANAALQMVPGGGYGLALFWPAAPVVEYLEAVKYRGKTE